MSKVILLIADIPFKLWYVFCFLFFSSVFYFVRGCVGLLGCGGVSRSVCTYVCVGMGWVCEGWGCVCYFVKVVTLSR